MRSLLILFLSFVLASAQVLYNSKENGVPILKTEGGECMAVVNGTRIQILGGPYTHEEVLGGKIAVEMPRIYKIKILEGKCKNIIGYTLEIYIKR